MFGTVAGVLVATMALLAACNTWDAPIPATPTPDAPCGAIGVVCSHDEKGYLCCSEGEVCGAAGTSCPAGECCYEGEDGMAKRKAARAR